MSPKFLGAIAALVLLVFLLGAGALIKSCNDSYVKSVATCMEHCGGSAIIRGGGGAISECLCVTNKTSGQ